MRNPSWTLNGARVAAIALKHEFGAWKWFGIAFAYQMVLAWGVAFLIYQGGRPLGFGG